MLRRAGHDVVGVYVRSWDPAEEGGRCTGDEDWRDAEEVGRVLGIEVRRVEAVKEYWNRVFEPALGAWAKGHTPNPDVACNVHIKFDALMRAALDLPGTRALATGHYARLQRTREGEVRLLKGTDARKDQSLFLCQVPQEVLRRAEFPLGHMTKEQVRDIAAKEGLPVAHKTSSRGLCFVGPRPFRSFLAQYLPQAPGPIRDLSGDATSFPRHLGLAFYTVGERLRISGLASRYYVYGKDIDRNTLLVCDHLHHPALYTHSFVLEDMRWISGRPPPLDTPFLAQYRVRHTPTTPECTVRLGANGQVHVRTRLPHRAVTPGQICALYDGDVCLGGGSIVSTGASLHELGLPVPPPEARSE